MKKDFDKFYNKLEQKRKAASEELDNKNSKQAKNVIIIIMAFGIITSIFTDFTVLVVCIILSVIVHLKVTNGLDRKDFYTDNIATEIVKDFKEYDLKYTKTKGISKSTYDKANYEKYDMYVSEDLITGKINNTQEFKISEVNTLYEGYDEKGNMYTNNIFLGVLGVVELNKSIKNTLKLAKNATYSVIKEISM